MNILNKIATTACYNFFYFSNQQIQKAPASYGDRFIPRRSNGFPDVTSSNGVREKQINTDLFEMKQNDGYWRLHKMDVMLSEVLGIDCPSTMRILKFNNVQMVQEPSFTNVFRFDWDCKPRKRPKAFAEAIHDLPHLKNFNGRHVIDWSERNEIVAVLKMKMVMWTLFTEKTTAYLLVDLRAVGFDVTGNYLALAVSLNRIAVIQVWDTSQYDKRYLVYTEELHCTSELEKTEVSALIWDDSNNVFCGCSNGTIFVWNLHQKRVIYTNTKTRSDAVIEMRFSCKFQYLATLDVSYTLHIFYWDRIRLEIHSKISRSNPIVFDFHPWKNTEIVLAETHEGRIVIVDLMNRKMVASYTDKANRCRIHAITFNKKTGELVISVEYKNKNSFEILVLGAMDRVVDVLTGHDKVVRHMIWSPNGNILATAGEDETFILWNFFGLPNVEQTCKFGGPKIMKIDSQKVMFKTRDNSKLAPILR